MILFKKNLLTFNKFIKLKVTNFGVKLVQYYI